MVCKNCGTQLFEDSKFCFNCGLKTEAVASTISAEGAETANETNDSSDVECENLTNHFSEFNQEKNDNMKLESDTKAAKRLLLSSLLILLIILCLAFFVYGIINHTNKQDGESSYDDSYEDSYEDYYSSGIDKRLGLSLKIDRIETSKNYTYVYCTVTNVSSKYIATRYRYVKVKAQFKDSSGAIVDTDWTYAIDSTWLEPGESKSFDYMVRNTNIKSATLQFVDD